MAKVISAKSEHQATPRRVQHSPDQTPIVEVCASHIGENGRSVIVYLVITIKHLNSIRKPLSGNRRVRLRATRTGRHSLQCREAKLTIAGSPSWTTELCTFTIPTNLKMTVKKRCSLQLLLLEPKNSEQRKRDSGLTPAIAQPSKRVGNGNLNNKKTITTIAVKTAILSKKPKMSPCWQ